MRRKIGHSVKSVKKAKTVCNVANTGHEASLTFFSGVRCYIHPANFGIRRLTIFQNHIRKYGGEIVEILPLPSEVVSHVIFEESIDNEKLKLLIDPSNYHNTAFIKCTWLVECVKTKAKIQTKEYEIIPVLVSTDTHKNKTSAVASEDGIKNPVPEQPEIKNKDKLLNYLGKSEKDSVGDHVVNTLTKKFTHQRANVNPDDVKEAKINLTSVPCDFKNSNLYNNEVYKKDNTSEEVKTREPVHTTSNIDQQNDNSENYQRYQQASQFPVKLLPSRFKDKFACSQPSSSKVNNLNTHITTELEKLEAVYKNKKDTWRAMGYQKAISAIRNHPREIKSREEALSIHGVGESLADKVSEIIESGKLRKVAEVCEGEEVETLKLFMGVWGAGPTTAHNWYTQGFRTLEDLRTKAALTRHQQIGLEHYEDINSRIPRDEVTEIEDYVRSAALGVQQGLTVMVCGSYRRGKPSCGDVDILVTHPDGHSHENIFKPLLKCLKETGFITNDLVTKEDNGNQQKYLGVCKLPGEGRKHRRLDVIVVPYAEFAPAVMYFTGSAHFNRSMRLLATKMGMSLSEHGLRAGIVRQGREKLTDGFLLETPTEESIFAHLGLDYRTPEERDH
nr:DNA polymerase lambda-like [Cherax quadricarinatus]XP_053645241.1 DNA polymerase lambda-like [Cherax quadricarinatus]XP_053645242.1 DNA polymerase lambda-like [Cherax quadricarinatus]